MVRWRAASEYEQHEAWSKYHQNILKPQTRKWPENMLTATLWFLMHELGLKHVFYHTHETGNQLKRIVHTAPPRSIYTDLPRKFCFEVSHNGPLFIRDSARRHLRQKFTDPRTKWYVLHV